MKRALAALPAREHLFVLSHMRSYSSVLSHILGSHPQIDGYCETHLKYRRRLDLIRLRYRVSGLTGKSLDGRYVLDKILHDYALVPAVLRHRRTRAIFMLRSPRPTVSSIVAMGERYRQRDWHRDIDRVARYYRAQLGRLAALAVHLGGRAAFLQSELLLERTDESLAFLSQFLELDAPLETSYATFEHTGEPGYGDPSAQISSGSVTARKERPELPLDASVWSSLEETYANCVASLRGSCQTLPP